MLLIGLCVLAYAPALTIPLVEDDYPHIAMSRDYGALDGLGRLFSDPTFRLRATSFWTMCAVWSKAGVIPLRYHLVSLLLHILAVLVLYLLASHWEAMRPGAFWAAAFFAVHEGHQEAVMWFSAINELLVFIFGLAAIYCWARAEKSPWWHVPGVLSLGFALISKEPAFILIPLFLLVRPRPHWSFVPYCGLTLLALVSVMQSRAASFRFSDGSFSLTAPFWITLPKGVFRLLWIWGLLALIFWIVRKLPSRAPLLALAWMAIALLPYSFLTYSTEIPSRQTYLASAGLALLAGVAFSSFSAWSGRRAAALVALTVIFYNAGILWTKKRRQFLERAAPTERLLAQIRSTTGPVRIRCFPRQRIIAEDAVRLAAPEALPRLIWDDSGPCP